jgi:hypothetical protein
MVHWEIRSYVTDLIYQSKELVGGLGASKNRSRVREAQLLLWDRNTASSEDNKQVNSVDEAQLHWLPHEI